MGFFLIYFTLSLGSILIMYSLTSLAPMPHILYHLVLFKCLAKNRVCKLRDVTFLPEKKKNKFAKQDTCFDLSNVPTSSLHLYFNMRLDI